MDAKDILIEFQNRQGWNDTTALELVLEYVDRQQSSDAFRDFLREIADREYSALDGDVLTQGGDCVVCGHWVEHYALGDALCGAVVHGECLAEHVAGCVECQEIGKSVDDTPVASLFLEHAGVRVYHVWHDGCLAQYWYSLDPDDTDIDDDHGHQFDVRDLPAPGGAGQWETREGHAAIIRAAIDAGAIAATTSL